MSKAMATFSSETESVCPVCLKRVSAEKVIHAGVVTMEKTCPDHGPFETILWRGEPAMETWLRAKEPVHPQVCYTDTDRGCPFDCGLCEAHEQLPCSVLLEVTERCNLQCPVCFADSDTKGEDPDIEKISFWYRRVMAAAGTCSIQLSGGEPTMRDDLPAIIELGRKIGFSFIQLNTNGLRLASERGYAHSLKKSGLTSVFLQFDGVDDDVYRSLRGRPLMREKLRAIEICGEAALGVVLVPTLLPGVNTHSIGGVVKLALNLAPVVRGVHFQPISYFGRYPKGPCGFERITLPEVMRALEEQTEGMVHVNDFSPPGCEHALCSFHGSFIRMPDGRLNPIAGKADSSCCASVSPGGVGRTIALVSRQWSAPVSEKTTPLICLDKELECGCACDIPPDGPIDLDTFLRDARSMSFTISCMAFQDAENLDLERLKGCCISIVAQDGRLVPFCAYNLTGATGQRLYRRENSHNDN
jgi:uncharacterized radical SAM superfamily Fe-S cluster-containing enzyme